MADSDDYVATFVAQAAELDPAIRMRVINLANLALNEAEFLIRHGEPRMKATIVRSFMTVFAKQMQVKKVDEEIEQLKEALQVLTTAVMGYKPAELVVDVNSDATADGPPA